MKTKLGTGVTVAASRSECEVQVRVAGGPVWTETPLRHNSDAALEYVTKFVPSLDWKRSYFPSALMKASCFGDNTVCTCLLFPFRTHWITLQGVS